MSCDGGEAAAAPGGSTILPNDEDDEDVAAAMAAKRELSMKEREVTAMRERRVADLEARIERKEAELGELRGKMHALREDFAYNLELLDERDRELERYDVQVARMTSEAEESARQVRDAQLAAAEAASEAKSWRQRGVEAEAHHAQRIAEAGKTTKREDSVRRRRIVSFLRASC